MDLVRTKLGSRELPTDIITGEFMVCKIAFYTALLGVLLFGQTIHAQKSPEELLDEINRLPASERQRKLEEGAKKEGELVWYSTMNSEDSLQLTRGFESQYPYINIKMISGGAPKTFNRIAAEYRAGSYLYDVTGYRAIFLNPSKKAGIIMRYQPPARQFLRPGFADHEGFFNGTFTRAFIFIVNTNLVASKDYPKSIPALLEPKYKGKLVMDNESYDFLAALLEYLR